jgi:hypothetical protein
MLEQLIPTTPASILDEKRNARVMSWVYTPAMSPNTLSLALARISASVLKELTMDTGPKISCVRISESLATLVNTVGSM